MTNGVGETSQSVLSHDSANTLGGKKKVTHGAEMMPLLVVCAQQPGPRSPSAFVPPGQLVASPCPLLLLTHAIFTT